MLRNTLTKEPRGMNRQQIQELSLKVGQGGEECHVGGRAQHRQCKEGTWARWGRPEEEEVQ